MEQIGKILKIEQISVDLGMDMNIEIIIARAEQLVKMESDSLQDKQTSIYNLQRKIKQLKEQLDNKELHLDLLRKKLTSPHRSLGSQPAKFSSSIRMPILPLAMSASLSRRKP